jgi:hypothetical protein
MARHPFILENHLEWELVGDPPRVITLHGIVICRANAAVAVDKLLVAWVGPHGRLMVRGERYAYNAYFPGAHNILRYDNGHADAEEFHRHVFDLESGREVSKDIIGRADMPTLGMFFTEVAGMIGYEVPDF